MKKLAINYLYLEITRKCTLQCEHCLRGKRENIDMSDEMLDNTFKDVTHIHELDLGGGEPLFVPKVIKKVIEKIKDYGIKVDKISFTTNGTILTQNTVDIMRDLSKIATLDVRISHDIFHLIEILERGIIDKVYENIALFKEMLPYDPTSQYFVADDGDIVRKGRAENLTEEDISKINGLCEKLGLKIRYRLRTLVSPSTGLDITMYDWGDNVVQVHGKVVISAKGKLVNMDETYKNEDTDYDISIQEQSLLDALHELEQKKKLRNDK